MLTLRLASSLGCALFDKFTSWPVMAASALALVSAFQPAGRRKGEDMGLSPYLSGHLEIAHTISVNIHLAGTHMQLVVKEASFSNEAETSESLCWSLLYRVK